MYIYEHMRYLTLLICLMTLLTACSSKPTPAKYRIGRDVSFYPINMMGKEKNFQAFLDDLMFAIGAEENFSVELYSSSANGLLLGLQEKVYDAIVTFEIPNVNSKQAYEFSTIFFPIGPVLLINKDEDFKLLETQKEKMIGIESNTSLDLAKIHLPSVILKSFDNIFLALDDLARNKIDGVVLNIFPAYIYTLGTYKNKIKVATSPLTDEGFRMVTLYNRSENDFIERFDRGFNSMKKNGTYRQLLHKWDLFDPEENVSIPKIKFEVKR